MNQEQNKSVNMRDMFVIIVQGSSRWKIYTLGNKFSRGDT